MLRFHSRFPRSLFLDASRCRRTSQEHIQEASPSGRAPREIRGLLVMPPAVSSWHLTVVHTAARSQRKLQGTQSLRALAWQPGPVQKSRSFAGQRYPDLPEECDEAGSVVCHARAQEELESRLDRTVTRDPQTTLLLTGGPCLQPTTGWFRKGGKCSGKAD